MGLRGASLIDVPRQYNYRFRIAIILIVNAGFLLLSLYVKTWTEHNIFPVLFPAVVLSAWVGGKLGGLISTAILAIGTAYYHMPPAGFAVNDPADLIRLGTFAFSGALVAWLSGALQENQGMMAATLRSIGDAVIATDRRGRVRFVNPLAEQLTGWSQDEAKGRHLAEVFRCADLKTGKGVPLPEPETMRSAAALPENTCVISKSNEQVPVDDSMAPIQTDSGRIVGAILVFRDATRRKEHEATLLESERQLLHSQRMEAVGRLAGGVAHDFNNLLTIISGYADLLLKRIDLDDSARSRIGEISKAGQKAAGLTRQLLAFSRGKPLKLEVIDLNQVVAEVEAMLRRLIGEDIELVTILSGEPLCVIADVGQIEQVIMNLATNARDAMPSGGRLTLHTGVREPDENVAGDASDPPPGPYALLAVTDTGVGIDEQTKLRLFEPFFTTKEVGKGTGLGLSTIYGIVKNHNGHIRVQSQPGRGSTFEVFLRRADGLPQAVTPAISRETHAGKATVLLVEDNPEIRQLARETLVSLGYIVFDAADSERALGVARDHADRIDLLVSDVVMPGLSGPELARRMAPLHPETRVLYISGYSDHDMAGRALHDPAVAFLQKPFTPSELARKVKDMLSNAQNG
jgi:two-component system, cell cycle sensor histidine kinase and response regulator CckA